MTILTDSERRLVKRCVEGATWISDFCYVNEAVAEILRATGIPLSTLTALADGAMVAVPEAENKELREALLDAAANLIGAVSAYNNYVGRVDQQGKKDPFFNTRYKDFKNAENRITAVLRKLNP